MIIEGFDWKNPDYVDVTRRRADALMRIRNSPGDLPALKAWYREHPWDFIGDWGMTFDPRNVGHGRSPVVPFVLFPRQREFLEWVYARWRASEPGLSDKSREVGVSWLAIGFACTECLFEDGFVAGFGSRKEEYVDKVGEPRSLLWKARFFMRYVPTEFKGGWNEEKHAPHMRIEFPTTGSHISGEAGKNIGRGDRTSIYFVDESAHLEHPMEVEHSLSQTTLCRIDMSSVNGMANPFAIKRHSGKVSVFTFRWQEDPRKDLAWYEKMCSELDEEVVAQEIDLNYQASVGGIIIPSKWILASVDAHLRLGITPTGKRRAALDVADGGNDANAMAVAHGVVVEHIEEWKGRGGEVDDIYGTVEKAFSIADAFNLSEFSYDADGLGVGVRGDARKINEGREDRQKIRVFAFRASGAVADPNGSDAGIAGTDGERDARKNVDFYQNAKAQGWWRLRQRFRATYLRVVEGKPCDDDEIISLPGSCKLTSKALVELSQPVRKFSTIGKMLVDKAPKNVPSPNLADAIMQLFSAEQTTMRISQEAVSAMARATAPQSTRRDPNSGGMRINPTAIATIASRMRP